MTSGLPIPPKPCKRPNCEEPRYGALTICKTHNNELQRKRYRDRIAANPLPPKAKKVWCNDCIAAGDPDPMERLPFSSYCQPHRAARDSARYHERKKALAVKLADMIEEQRTESYRREAVRDREWEANKGKDVEDLSDSFKLSPEAEQLMQVRQQSVRNEERRNEERLQGFGPNLPREKLA